MPRKSTIKATGVWEREPGSNIWWIRYRADGVLKREKVGRKSDALALYQKRKSELRAGVKLPDNMRQSSLRFKALCDDILVYSEKHHRDYRSVVSRISRIVRDFGDLPVDKIKPSEIDLWLSKTTKTPATSNRYRALFSLIFREALRNGKVSSNPARLVRQQHENNGRIRFLTEAEEDSLRAVIADRYPEHEPELTISLGTGMRLSEQYGLTWRNVDFVRREINLDRTKNGSPRMIPMNDTVIKAMQEFSKRSVSPSRDALVFPTKNPKRWFLSALSQAKVENYRWHDNRHTFCSRLAMRGENLKVIQQLAGHKTIQMSARYAHLGEKSLHSAVDGLCS
jgi:site-specific recombinase XerD